MVLICISLTIMILSIFNLLIFHLYMPFGEVCSNLLSIF